MEKKLPEILATLLTPENVQGRPVRLMFRDEARFGRMVRIRRCWSPAPQRPSVPNGYERQFVYVYAAVSPIGGEMDWMVSQKMNTEQMSAFLSRVSAAHPEDFIIMVLDGASSNGQKIQGLSRYLIILRNSTRKNMYGMNSGRKSSPTVCSTISML